jgi:dipeptidyl aminopeptidase/acylaminoacyl peptidase
MPIGAFNNNLVGAMGYLPPAALAELGFIVVMINSRGTGLRDSVFNASNVSLAEKYHQEDCIAGIKQLAERYAYIDISRVGVGGFSSISMALTGLLKHPDFYTVGVSSSPGGDGAMNSAMVGMVGAKPRDEPALEALAKNLRGKLLLIHGMNDNVCPVAITFRLIEALQKANKTFDMLLLPNMGHDPCAYTTRRMWDYFVQHLLGEQPPTDFKLTTGIDLYMAELANDAQVNNAQSNSRETD